MSELGQVEVRLGRLEGSAPTKETRNAPDTKEKRRKEMEWNGMKKRSMKVWTRFRGPWKRPCLSQKERPSPTIVSPTSARLGLTLTLVSRRDLTMSSRNRPGLIPVTCIWMLSQISGHLDPMVDDLQAAMRGGL